MRQNLRTKVKNRASVPSFKNPVKNEQKKWGEEKPKENGTNKNHQNYSKPL